MLGLLAVMALIRSRTGRTLLRCLAIVGILFVYNYLILVKVIIVFLLISEIAAWMIPLLTPREPERSSTFLPGDVSIGNDEMHGPHRAPWRQQEWKQQEEMHGYLNYSVMQPERSPTIFTAAANTSHDGNRTGPSRSNRRQKEEIDRHLQRLATAAAEEEAATAAAAAANVMRSHYYGKRVSVGYPNRIGDTLGVATITSSNLSPAQADNYPESTNFWTRRKFPVSTAATPATSNRRRYGSPGLGHSKSLPEPAKMYSDEGLFLSWKD